MGGRRTQVPGRGVRRRRGRTRSSPTSTTSCPARASTTRGRTRTASSRRRWPRRAAIETQAPAAAGIACRYVEGGPGPPARRAASQVASAIGAGVGFGSQDGRFWASEQSAGHGPRPFVVFNPTAHDREEVVEATVWDNAPGTPVPMKSRTFAVRTPDGKLIPAQVVGGLGYWGHDAATVAFPVKAQGLGYTEYTILESLAADAAPAAPASTARVTGKQHHCFYAPTERAPKGWRTISSAWTSTPRQGASARSSTSARAWNSSPRARRPRLSNTPSSGPTACPPGRSRTPARPRPRGSSPSAGCRAGRTRPSSRSTCGSRSRTSPSRTNCAPAIRNCTYTFKGTWFQRGTPQTGVPVLRIAFPLALEGASAIRDPLRRDRPRLQPHGGDARPPLAQVSGTAGGKAAGCVLAQ